MIHPHPERIDSALFLSAALLITTVGARDAHAADSTGMMALAAPLAEQFGVPADLVTGLLESGISLDSVTQLLLVSNESEKGLDDVTALYHESGDKIDETAAKLEVAKSEYSAEKVTAAIDEAKAKAQADAAKKAGDAASDAVGSVLGGFNK
jgi:hypothetical protein